LTGNVLIFGFLKFLKYICASFFSEEKKVNEELQSLGNSPMELPGFAECGIGEERV